LKSRKKGIGKREAILLIAVVIIIVTTVIIIVGKNKNVEEQNVGTTNNLVTVNKESNYEESENGIKTNISNKVKEIKTVGDFKIEETKIIYASGVSTITAKLINNGIEKELVKLKIKLITTDGKVLKEIETQTGEIKQNGEKYIKASITEDVVDVANIEYEIID
jgi:hypothetical protein